MASSSRWSCFICADYLHFMSWVFYRDINNCTVFLGYPMALHKGRASLLRLVHCRLLQIQVYSIIFTFIGRWKFLCLPSAAACWHQWSAARQEKMGTGWHSLQAWGPHYAGVCETREWKFCFGLPMGTNCKAISFPQAWCWHKKITKLCGKTASATSSPIGWWYETDNLALRDPPSDMGLLQLLPIPSSYPHSCRIHGLQQTCPLVGTVLATSHEASSAGAEEALGRWEGQK